MTHHESYLMQAVAGPDAAAHAITQHLACQRPSCRCHQTEKKGVGLTHCPVHTDNDPSFNVTIKNGTVLLHCQATCSQEDVISALRERDLWPKEIKRPSRTIIATYDYLDPHGNLLYQSVRYAPKDFSQRRPDGHGGWLWNLEGVQRVLFRLPDLLAANPTRLRFIVEGEKDVETLRSHGLVATSNVGGAGKWRPEYSEWFHDRDVVLIPDNDEPGRKHMLAVAEGLTGIAHSIRWLDLPGADAHGDVTDWFSHGGTPDSFKDLVRKSPLYTPELASAKQQAPHPLSNLSLEQSLIAWCFELRETANYVRMDDLTDPTLRRALEQFQRGEVVDTKPVGVPEADPGLDVDEAIRSLRELAYRRATLRIADCIIKAASDTQLPFDPCIAADVLRAVCESDQVCVGVAPRLSECLDLS